MSDDELRAAARRFFEEVWNKGNVSETEAFLAPEFVSHNTLDVRIVGPSEYSGAVTDFRAAFPDHHTPLEDVLVDGDRVVVRGTDRGDPSRRLHGVARLGSRDHDHLDRDLPHGERKGR